MSLTVLVVDDDADVRNSIRDLLAGERPDWRVLTAADGEEAVPLLPGTDIIVSDYVMPQMDGLSVLTMARRRHPRILRILMTAYPDLQVALRAINEAGVWSFLVKPIGPVHLLEILDNAALRAKALRSGTMP